MKRKTVFKNVSILAIALSMSLTSQSAQMMLPVFAQAVRLTLSTE